MLDAPYVCLTNAQQTVHTLRLQGNFFLRSAF